MFPYSQLGSAQRKRAQLKYGVFRDTATQSSAHFAFKPVAGRMLETLHLSRGESTGKRVLRLRKLARQENGSERKRVLGLFSFTRPTQTLRDLHGVALNRAQKESPGLRHDGAVHACTQAFLQHSCDSAQLHRTRIAAGARGRTPASVQAPASSAGLASQTHCPGTAKTDTNALSAALVIAHCGHEQGAKSRTAGALPCSRLLANGKSSLADAKASIQSRATSIPCKCPITH